MTKNEIAMERPIGNIFACDGLQMKVYAAESFCRGCFFHGKVVRKQKHCDMASVRAQIGKCRMRTDGSNVIFKRDTSKFY
jgi:hypothetical protein